MPGRCLESTQPVSSAGLDDRLGRGGIPALLQPLSGDLIARAVAVHQPAKLAAMEAPFTTEAGPDFVLGGIADAATAECPMRYEYLTGSAYS